MLKKIGISTLALVALLVMANPAPAKAEVRFGLSLGVPPVYSYPADPYAYPAPYAYPYNYYATPPTYIYPAPAYGYGFNYRFGGHDRDRRYFEQRDHERREHDFRGGEGGHRR